MANELKGFILGSLLACISGLSFAQQAIMPVGNSITGGQDRPSYRLPLLDELAAVSCTVDMVGDQTLNSFDFRDPVSAPGSHAPGFSPDLGYDTDHQAFPGIRTEQLVAGVPTPPGSDQFPVSPLSAYVSAEQPDFVLLHTGTNDLNGAISQGLQTAQELDTWANQTISEVDMMIDQIFLSHNNPADLRVLLANFIPYKGPFSDPAQIDAALVASGIFTQKLEEFVATKGNPRLLIVDVATGFDVDTMTFDGVHPNSIGEQHIAGAFLPVLFGAGLCAATNNVPFITAPANGETVNGDPLTITWDDNGFVADSWQVYVGDTQSGNSSTYFDSGVLGTSVRSVTVPTLPQDGSNVFIALNYSSGGMPNQIITRFVSDPVGVTSPTITSPVPGSVLPGSDVTFNWSDNGTAVTQWYFRIGSTFGGEDYASTRFTNGAQRSAAFSGLPTDGSRVFVEFSHRTPESVWVSSNLEYDATDDTPVNEPPVAVDDALGPVDVGQTLNLDVLANDTDSDGTVDISTVTITVEPTEGSATVLATGEIEYIHDGNTTTGTDTLSYTVSDDLGAVSNEAVVNITVNEAPVANDDTDGPLDAGASITIDVLANDTDSDGTVDPATVAIATQPAAG
ncbi:MAG: Ig-like domain-containing protein, partial [Granulosicoccus sp.]